MNRKSDQSIPLIFIVLLTATFVLGCSILKSDKKEEGGTGTCFTSSMTTHTTVWDV